ncbi:MAG: hypothetical protein M1819_001055 [Sarea resinae]|nr:MAG: hypothetical protein M1819_001055 [Sarea resinae]
MAATLDGLRRASDFYSRCKLDFDKETMGVRGYADREILDQLWILRAKTFGKKDKQQQQGSHGLCGMGEELLDLLTHASFVSKREEQRQAERRDVRKFGDYLETYHLFAKELKKASQALAALMPNACILRRDIPQLGKGLNQLLAILEKGQDVWSYKGDRDMSRGKGRKHVAGRQAGNRGPGNEKKLNEQIHAHGSSQNDLLEENWEVEGAEGDAGGWNNDGTDCDDQGHGDEHGEAGDLEEDGEGHNPSEAEKQCKSTYILKLGCHEDNAKGL